LEKMPNKPQSPVFVDWKKCPINPNHQFLLIGKNSEI